jgi:hypothetical protein
MKGTNRFPSLFSIKESHAGTQSTICVFISHSRKDKAQAREVAEFITDLGLDIYFDEKDRSLQLADEVKDHAKVVKCIQDGIEHSTHLLGVVTENTKESWWVPYEIGFASGKKNQCAHLIQAEVTQLPSYIQSSNVLADTTALESWLPEQHENSKNARAMILEKFQRITATTKTAYQKNSFFAYHRQKQIGFY